MGPQSRAQGLLLNLNCSHRERTAPDRAVNVDKTEVINSKARVSDMKEDKALCLHKDKDDSF